MQTLIPSQSQRLHDLLAPILRQGNARHLQRFTQLMELVKTSVDGRFTRAQMNQRLYVGVEPASRKSDLALLKEAIRAAATVAGVGKVVVVTPRGQGSGQQFLHLEIEKPLGIPVPQGTADAAQFIGMQTVVKMRATELDPDLMIAVSFAGADQALAEGLVKSVETALKGRSTPIASRVKFWMFRRTSGQNGIVSGEQDHAAMQKAFANCALGMLLVSPSACASKYIQNHEWPLFRTPKKGRTRKAFIAVELLRVKEGVHELGVLDRSPDGNRTQLFAHLEKDGTRMAWGDCEKNAGAKHDFVEKLCDEMLLKLANPLPPTASTKRPKREDTSGEKAERFEPPQNFPLNPQTNGIKQSNPTDTLGIKPESADPSKKLTLSPPPNASATHRVSVDAYALEEQTGLQGQDHRSKNHPREDQGPESTREVPTHANDEVLIVDALVAWATDSKQTPYGVLLGEYGTGKTWSSELLAKVLIENGKNDSTNSTPTPIYLDLRKANNDRDSLLGANLPTLEVLLEKLLARNTPAGKKAPTVAAVLQAVQQEGAVLIFDGLDEVLAHHRDEAWGQAFIDLLFTALPFRYWPKDFNPDRAEGKPGKVLVTCRDHYFKSENALRTELLGISREHQASARPKAWRLLPFNEEQIKDYLTKHFKDQNPQVLYDTIASVHNLKEVCSRAQGLKMVCQQIYRIEEARDKDEEVNGATLYEWMVEEWLNRDKGKHLLLPEDKIQLMKDLSLHLWQNGLRSLAWEPLSKWFRTWLYADPVRRNTPEYQGQDAANLLTDLRNATFLVRPEQDKFSFAHTSFLEYFLALRLYQDLEIGQWDTWQALNPSPETLVFINQHHALRDAATKHRPQATLQKLLSPTAADTIRSNGGEPAHAQAHSQARALGFALWHAAPTLWPLQHLDVSGLDLTGTAFSHLRLDTLLAQKAQLGQTTWVDCQVKQATFEGAWLQTASFLYWRGDMVNLTQAVCGNSQWQNIRIARLTSQGADFAGAKISDWPGYPLASGPTHPPLDLANWVNSPQNLPQKTLARLGFGRDEGHSGAITSVAICPWLENDPHNSSTRPSLPPQQRFFLLTGSNDKTAKLWDQHGSLLTTLEGHSDSVTSVAICPWLEQDPHNSSTGPSLPPQQRFFLLTGSLDNTAKLWDQHGSLLATLTGHSDWVTSVAICPWLEHDPHNSSTRPSLPPQQRFFLLTGSDDKTAKLWDQHGSLLATLTGHRGPVVSVAFDSQSHRLVTQDGTQTRVWRRYGTEWRVEVALHTRDGTRVWLDEHEQALVADGPGWNDWRITQVSKLGEPTGPSAQSWLGSVLPRLGPMAHTRLSNADDWKFWPRSDLQRHYGLEKP
jgi:hypothetical protein